MEKSWNFVILDKWEPCISKIYYVMVATTTHLHIKPAEKFIKGPARIRVVHPLGALKFTLKIYLYFSKVFKMLILKKVENSDCSLNNPSTKAS